jgi:hypothetical protein
MLTKIDERQLAGEPSRQWKIVLNDVFEKRARAAAVVGWWVVLCISSRQQIDRFHVPVFVVNVQNFD